MAALAIPMAPWPTLVRAVDTVVSMYITKPDLVRL